MHTSNVGRWIACCCYAHLVEASLEEGEDYMLAANVPIYGTGDAGRKFYKGFRAKALAAGFRECRFAKSLYVYEVDGDIKVMMGPTWTTTFGLRSQAMNLS